MTTVPSRSDQERLTDRHIGPYRLLRELGRGGMGIVYLAERADGQFRRQVAVKVLRVSPDAETLRRRFLAERQILASLNHPNIAQLLDGGVADDGQLPFLVMEYVDGVPITTYCDQQRLTIEERLALFHDVCAAVHHAHSNLVLHRDIKPGNILVTNDRRVKLLDFGIAKLMNPILGPDDMALTQTALRVMTPEYASPEQVRGDSLTTASDVYALGVLLYALLSGRRTHRLTSGSVRELTEVIVEREPERPSTAVLRPEPRSGSQSADTTAETIATNRRVSVDRLRARLDGDLDAIVMMALRKESARRYGSVDLMWEDIQRHLDGLPVLADHGTPWYRARSFLRRHRMPAVAVAVVTLSLVTGTTVAVRQATMANRERQRAEQALAQSREVTEFLVRLFRTPAPPGASRDEVTARDLLAAGVARADQLSGQPLVQAQMLDALGRVTEQLGGLENAERLLRRALALRRAQYGDNHLSVASTMLNLSAIIRQRGLGDEALKLAEDALAIQRRVLGPKHPQVGQTLTTVAVLTTDASVAESLLRVARDIEIGAYGPSHVAVTNTNYVLANLLAEREAYADAEVLFRENLAIRQQLFGRDDAATAISMVELARFLATGGNQPVAAESMYVAALGILRRQGPQYVTNVVGALTGLVGLASDAGDHRRAEGYAREAMELQRRVWGPDHPMITDPMGMLAEELYSQRRFAEAESLIRDALEITERTVGAQHGRAGLVRTALARTHAAMGRLAEAEADFRRAIQIAEKEGPNDRWVAAPSALLADVLTREGRPREADALWEHAAEILRPLPPQLALDMKLAYAALADHYRAVGRPADESHFRALAHRP